MNKFLKHIVCLLYLICINCYLSYSQTGKTYALVIGVSNYKHPLLTDLLYADKDAISFTKMLINPAIGVDSNNIHLHLNKNATVSNILCSYSWLESATKKGDIVYFYFSGHGDAVDPNLVYLLPYDADGADPNNYEFTALGMVKIKSLMSKLVNKGVQPYLFIDACRSNELHSTDSIHASKGGIMYVNNGEIQFTSTSANDVSFEDYRWGNGHGVFTYYLIKGWLGLADRDEDGVITVYELGSYVKSEVHRETRDYYSKITLQKPTYCCSQAEDKIVTKVDEDMLVALRKAEEQEVDINYNNPIVDYDNPASDIINIYTSTKASNFNYSQSPSTKILLDSVINCIKYNRIYETKGSNAKLYYDKLLNTNQDTILLNNIKSQVLTILLQDVQRIMDVYINKEQNAYNGSIISTTTKKIEFAIQIAGKENVIYEYLKERAYFFKAQQNLHQSQYSKAVAYIDSAISINPRGAYNYLVKGLIEHKTNNIENSLKNFDKAIQLAPNWSKPYQTKSYTYLLTGKQELAKIIIDSMLIANGKSYNYLMAGNFYFSLGKFSEASQLYNKAIKLDASNEHAIIGAYVTGKILNSSDYLPEIKNPNSKDVLSKQVKYFEKIFDFEKSAQTYLELFKIDTNNLSLLVYYAKSIINTGDLSTGKKTLQKIIKSDPSFKQGYIELAYLYEQLGQYDSALYYHKLLYKTDPSYNPANLYKPFKELGLIDSANAYLTKASKNSTFSSGLNQVETSNNQAIELIRKQKYNDALLLLNDLETKGIFNCETYTLISVTYDGLGNGDKAIEYANMAIECEPTNDLNYRNLALYYKKFRNRTDSAYSIILKPYKLFKCQSRPYLVYTCYILSFTKDLNTLKSFAEFGNKQYPNDFEFDLYLAIYYYEIQKMDNFYKYFEESINKGLDERMYAKHQYRFEPFLDNDAKFQSLKQKIKK